MDTLGNPTRFILGLALLAFIAPALVACGAKTATDPGGVAGTRTPQPTTTTTVPAVRHCTVPPPAQITQALTSGWARVRNLQILPFTSTATGDRVVATVRSASFYGVALVNLRTNAVQPIDRFRASTYQALGAYDGQVAVWKEFHSQNGLDDFSVKEWSASTNSVATVGGSHKDPATGKTFPSPWTEPALGSGHAAWVEGTDFTGRGRLVLLDTKSGLTTVDSSGHPGGALLIYGSELVWAQSTKPGALTTVFAKSLITGRPATPPAALSAQRGGSSFATDGRGIAWVGPDQNSLYYSGDGQKAGQLVTRLAVGGFNPPTVLRGSTVMTADSDGVLAAETSGATTTVVQGGGSVTGTADGFLVGAAPQTKSQSVASRLALLGPDAFVKLRCSG